jgi:putative ABC transport system substrate-binding protein
MPIVGYVRSTPSGPFAHFFAAFRKGLEETGFIEGKNIVIEQRHADNQIDRLPAMVADLIHRQAAVIVCNGPAAKATKAASANVPIVFVTGSNPVEEGLVTSLSRPGGNATGVTFFAGEELIAKRVEMLHELAPSARSIAVLVDPNNFGLESTSSHAMVAGRAIKRHIVILKASTESEIEAAFNEMAKSGAGGLVVGGSPMFASRRQQLVALAARHSIPAIYNIRDFASAGGLISYAGNVADAYRLAGVYAGRILKGAKPAELPVQQPTTIELVVNLKTAKTLGITVPQTILIRADEVIQ